MTDLSPAAQTVLNALLEAKFGKEAVELGFPVMSVILGRELAAALRAAADQVAPEVYFAYTGNGDWDHGMEARNDTIREAILAIAEELENQ
jgi:hypothetical protein